MSELQKKQHQQQQQQLLDPRFPRYLQPSGGRWSPSSSSMAHTRRLVKSGIMINLMVSTLIMLALPSSSSTSSSASSSLSSSPLVEARRSSGGSANLLTKKPPFNGSIFGKRSGVPPRAQIAPPMVGYDGVLRYTPASYYTSAGSELAEMANNNINSNNNFLLAMYQQQQQLQQQEAAIARAAVKRCLLQREQLAASDGSASDVSMVSGSCDELLAYLDLGRGAGSGRFY